VTASGAVLNGTVNPQGANGYAGFYWGTDPTLTQYTLSCGQWYSCPAVAPNFTAQAFGATLSGLTSNTTYYFRMVFYDTDNGSLQYRTILNFTTQ